MMTLTAYLAQRNITPSTAETFGLSVATAGTFRNRLLFPIHDARGQQIAVAGRVLDDSTPKYINSRESAAYRKSEVLYNLHRAWPTIRKTGFVWLVEGYMDVISAWQVGTRNVVACCGTALTPEHCRLIRRMGARPILALDNDAAGRNATAKASEMLLRYGLHPMFADLAMAKDPDAYVQVAGHFMPEVREVGQVRDPGSADAILRRAAQCVASIRDRVPATGDDFGDCVDRLAG